MTLGRSLYPPGSGPQQPMTHSPARFGNKLGKKQDSKMVVERAEQETNELNAGRINPCAQRRARDGKKE